jgi:hypothetical protein
MHDEQETFCMTREVFGAGAFDLEESTATATSTLF